MNASPDGDLAYLVLVDNPTHHPDGDFAFDRGRIVLSGENMLTFSGIGLYRPKQYEGIVAGSVAKLAPRLGQAIALGKAGGQHYRGTWADIGTPERLRQIDLELSTAGAPTGSPAASS